MVRLTQIVDESLLIALQKRLTNSLKMSVVFEEPNMGLLNVIGERGGVCKVCTNFIDTPETGRDECLKSDSGAAQRAKEKLELGAAVPVEFYICNGQFRNFVIPVSIAGEALGNVYAGQFLVEPLVHQDPDYEKKIKVMTQLGMSRGRALLYASLPSEDDFPKIIHDNRVPKKMEAEFEEAYKEMFKKAFSISYVVDAVYLLHEIAQTISSLGNVYYYNNVFSKLMHILPTELKLVNVDLIREINAFLLRLEIHPPLSYSEEITHANEAISRILDHAADYFKDYIDNLLTIYKEVAESSDILEKAESLLVVGEAKFETRRLHEIAGPPLRDREISERGRKVYSPQANKLLDEAVSLLTKTAEILSEEKATVLSRNTIQQLSKFVDEMRTNQENLLKHKLGKPIATSTIDAIETYLEYIDDEESGLRTIIDYLQNKRVLDRISDKWRKFREKLRLRYDVIYLNWGGISPTFDVAIASGQLWSLGLDRFGPVSIFSEDMLESSDKENVLQKARLSISKVLHCSDDEVILTPNTTRGISLALSSIHFPSKESKTKERILLSNLEHDTVRNCVNKIAKNFGVSIDLIEISEKQTEETISDQIITESLDGRTKVVILSHIAFSTGRVLNVAEIIHSVRERIGSKAPIFIVDGAQAVGHMPVDVREIGSEFYAADGYKWLNGPKGGGFLFVKKDYLEKHSQEFELYEKYAISPKYTPKDPETGQPYEPATFNVEPHVGLTRTLDLFLQEENAEKRFDIIRSLADRFRELLKDRLNLYNIEIANHTSSPGIVTFRFKDVSKLDFYEDFRKSLDERFKIKCRSVDEPHPALRFCVSYLNSDEEIELSSLAIRKLLEESPLVMKKKKAEKKTKLEKRRREAILNVEELFREAQKILKIKEKKTREKFIWYHFDGRGILKEKQSQLREKKTEIIKEIEECRLIDVFESLEKETEDEFRKIVEGKG